MEATERHRTRRKRRRVTRKTLQEVAMAEAGLEPKKVPFLRNDLENKEKDLVNEATGHPSFDQDLRFEGSSEGKLHH